MVSRNFIERPIQQLHENVEANTAKIEQDNRLLVEEFLKRTETETEKALADQQAETVAK